MVRYRSSDIQQVLASIRDSHYGLTLGVQTRLESFWRQVFANTSIGNTYVNRNMIGAVVGVQPFGGNGLSGTGPKAGGPHYLTRFANERTLTVNTTATGGNAALLNLGNLDAGHCAYLRLVPGDVNGFLGLVVDNFSVLALLAAVLIGGFGIPADHRVRPDVSRHRTRRPDRRLALHMAGRDVWRGAPGAADVTAMPFGLDTPSTIGMAVLVLGPAFAKFRAAGLEPTAAGLETWYLGMAATATMGAIKLLLSFAGRGVRRVIPQAGLLGSLAGIALMLIGFLPLIELLQVPVVGCSPWACALRAAREGGSAPSHAGRAVRSHRRHRVLLRRGPFGFSACRSRRRDADRASRVPAPGPGHLARLCGLGGYLPLMLPFALLTVVGGVNNTESARVAGDDYDVRSILLAEAGATLLAGLAGGVAQTTPYIGHRAYKQMGARAGYTLLTGFFIGVGGMLGFLSNLIELIPIAVLAPVLVFVALDITAQAFRRYRCACDRRGREFLSFASRAC